MPESRKFIYYSLGLYSLYTVVLYILGYFNIGLLSDDYLNIYDALNSTFYEKLIGHLPFANSLHIRPINHLSLEKSVTISKLLGFANDNFIWFRIQNLMLLIFIAFISGLTVYYLTKRSSVSMVASVAILLFPNNINNICWMAARTDLLCCLFYVITILLFFLYSDTNKKMFFILSIFTFIFALFTKELAITLPIVVLLLGYFRYGREGLRKSQFLIITLGVILLSYFVFRILILGNNFTEIATLYQTNPLSNAPGVFARALIALSIPLDFISLNYQLRSGNKIIVLYLFILYGAGFYFIWTSLRSDIYKMIGNLAVLFFILIAPYAIVGYLRPQMILLPFVIITIYVLYLYSQQKKLSVRLKKNVLKICFIAALIFWGYWSGEAVSNWLTSYEKAKVNVDNLIKTPHDTTKLMILIGNPGRFKQTFMFDKMTGAYNFWKTKNFVIKDTINDIIQTAAIQESSIGAKLECKIISENEFEIKAIAPKQFFYIEGYDNEKIKMGFKNSDISVEFTEFNNVSKPIKLKLVVLSQNVECFLAEELGFRKIY